MFQAYLKLGCMTGIDLQFTEKDVYRKQKHCSISNIQNIKVTSDLSSNILPFPWVEVSQSISFQENDKLKLHFLNYC